jgi:PKD repeat protein
MRKQLLFLMGTVMLSLGFGSAQSQNVPFRRYCATDSITEAAMRQNPDYAKKRQEFMKYVKSLNAQSIARINASPQYTIPIVVHIIHTYGVDNISDAQVNDAVRIINQDFQKKNTDTASVIPVFQPLYANVGFQFRLARKDPNGNCTNGITRTFSPLTNNADDNVKGLIMWDPTKYLNIWVVSQISFGAGGYSYLPCGVPQTKEGVVILSTQFGSTGRSGGSNFAARSLTHEIGHYMGLPHTWGGSNTPGDPSNCGMDDGITDTPNTVGSTGFTCNTNARTCNPPSYPFPDNVQNYMDYSSCAAMFTTGQKAVMVSALTLFCRSNLYTQANLVATGTNDGYTAICAPTADFKISTDRVCSGNTITYNDMSYNNITGNQLNYFWTFQGGTPATSTLQNPVVVYNTPGNYDVTLSTTNIAGSNTLTKSSLITVKSSQSVDAAPYLNEFEMSGFPVNSANPAKNWEIIKPGTIGWEQTTAAAASGIYSLRVRNSNIPAGTVNKLISAPLNISTVSNPLLKFKVAYAQKNTTSSDKLIVYLSEDCGTSWISRYTKSGAGLSTTGSLISGSFIPSSTQWRQESVIIPNTFAVDNVLLKFEATSELGNTIYLDDVQISGIVLGTEEDNAIKTSFNISPNPSNGDATVSFALPNATDFSLEVLTVTGQKVGATLNRKAQSNQQELKLNEITGQQLVPGIYMVKLQANGFTTLKKAIVF